MGAGEIDGRPVVVYAEDPKALGGSLGAAHAQSICRALDIAERAQVPVVGLVSSAGARLQEGLAALAGYGEIFHRIVKLSGVVPQISVVCGPSAGGGAYAPALTDLVIMTREAAMFLTGPGVVREVMGEDVDAAGLGGPRVQSANGVCHLVGDDEAHAVELARRALSYLPSVAGGPLAQRPYSWDPCDPGRHVPSEHRKVYDVRDVIGDIVDRGSTFELAPRWARNVVTAFARIEGSPVGVLANQPRHLGGVIDADAAQKAARFVRTCHLFGLPLVVLVDTPGFLPGTKQEGAGVIRHGAKLVHAFAEADVPKITFVLRKSYGGAHIAMNSGALGADMTFAWPDAQLGVMGAPQAVQFVNKREIAAADDPGRRTRPARRRLRGRAARLPRRGDRRLGRRAHRTRRHAGPHRVGDATPLRPLPHHAARPQRPALAEPEGPDDPPISPSRRRPRRVVRRPRAGRRRPGPRTDHHRGRRRVVRDADRGLPSPARRRSLVGRAPVRRARGPRDARRLLRDRSPRPAVRADRRVAPREGPDVQATGPVRGHHACGEQPSRTCGS